LEAVVKLPAGVFKPYAGVSTAILIFTKGGQTTDVWFYDVQADGYSLDDKRDNHEEPTVLITCRGATCGTINVCEPKSYVTGNAMALDELDINRADLRFVAYALNKRGLRDAITGSAQPQITRTSLSGVEIPLPPLSEQKRIADILDKADAIRRKRQETELMTDNLAESAFIEFFGHPLGPCRWPQKPIGEVGAVSTGNTPSTKNPEFFDGKVPWVRPTELGNWWPVSQTAKTLSESGLRVARSIRAGGTLVCCIGATLGKVGIVDRTSSFNQQINAVDFGEDVDDWYGMFCMRLMAPRFIAEATHTTLPILNKGDFSRQQMPVPPIEQQNRFGKFVDRLLASRTPLTAATDQARSLFDSLVQRAFKGEL
jgi:type I restriction enzyme, S subunit